MRRLLIAVLLLTFALVPQASATDTVLAPAPDATGITAYGGHVVFSQYDAATDHWALVRWHGGVIDHPPVAERPVPFDAAAGPDADGNPVVVYSRCVTEPAVAAVPDWETARGCDVYELPLTGAPTERKLGPASSASASETTPSMWNGALAFARHADGSGVPTVRYLPAGASRSRRLGGGSVQSCGRLCAVKTVHDTVDQLDLGPSRVAYVWRMTGGNVYGTGIVWELRATALHAEPSTLLDTGLVSGACGFDHPTAPDAAASPIGYLRTGAECDVTTTRFATIDPATSARASAPTPGGLAAGAARDGSTIYWLRITDGGHQLGILGAGGCGESGKSCELVASTEPGYASDKPHPEFPQADIDLVRSGTGYSWVHGPAGVRLLRPPARSRAPRRLSPRSSAAQRNGEADGTPCWSSAPTHTGPGASGCRRPAACPRASSRARRVSSAAATACGSRTRSPPAAAGSA